MRWRVISLLLVFTFFFPILHDPICSTVKGNVVEIVPGDSYLHAQDCYYDSSKGRWIGTNINPSVYTLSYITSDYKFYAGYIYFISNESWSVYIEKNDTWIEVNGQFYVETTGYEYFWLFTWHLAKNELEVTALFRRKSDGYWFSILTYYFEVERGEWAGVGIRIGTVNYTTGNSDEIYIGTANKVIWTRRWIGAQDILRVGLLLGLNEGKLYRASTSGYVNEMTFGEEPVIIVETPEITYEQPSHDHEWYYTSYEIIESGEETWEYTNYNYTYRYVSIAERSGIYGFDDISLIGGDWGFWDFMRQGLNGLLNGLWIALNYVGYGMTLVWTFIWWLLLNIYVLLHNTVWRWLLWGILYSVDAFWSWLTGAFNWILDKISWLWDQLWSWLSSQFWSLSVEYLEWLASLIITVWSYLLGALIFILSGGSVDFWSAVEGIEQILSLTLEIVIALTIYLFTHIVDIIYVFTIYVYTLLLCEVKLRLLYIYSSDYERVQRMEKLRELCEYPIRVPLWTLKTLWDILPLNIKIKAPNK